MSGKNLFFEYGYVDKNNFHEWDGEVLANPDGRSADEVYRILAGLSERGKFFIASTVGLDDQCAAGFNDDTDHGWHEISTVMETDEEATIQLTVEGLIAQFQRASELGWEEDPCRSAPVELTPEQSAILTKVLLDYTQVASLESAEIAAGLLDKVDAGRVWIRPPSGPPGL